MGLVVEGQAFRALALAGLCIPNLLPFADAGLSLRVEEFVPVAHAMTF